LRPALSCSLRLNMGVISDMTHIEVIFILSRVLVLVMVTQCSSEHSATHLINILHFSRQTVSSRNPHRRVKSGEWDNLGMDPSLECSDQETLQPERHEAGSDMRHHVSGRLFAQGHDT
jgi:hypothetical protein